MALSEMTVRHARITGYELACANQCPPTTSIAAPPSAKRYRWLLVAKRSGLVPDACKTNTNRRRPYFYQDF